MNIVLFTHPEFQGSHSHPHFARMLSDAYRQRGHLVEVRQPRAVLRRRIARGSLAKWAGYVDQYVLFPLAVRLRARSDSPNTLYVFCDQALGPWIPLVSKRPHVVHCHDFLALRSALGEIAENPTSFTGRVYQRYIRWGFQHARHFISVSHKTRGDLHRYGSVQILTSEVVYNGLNRPYRRVPKDQARDCLRAVRIEIADEGFLLHVGGGQWYKNTEGVLAIFSQLARMRIKEGRAVPPLVMVSPTPCQKVKAIADSLPPEAKLIWLQGVSFAVLESLYSSAEAFLFPSLEEGFGWPIAEAMACGCPVLTTGEAPMNEVGGAHAHYLPRLAKVGDLAAWSEHGANRLSALLERPDAERLAAAEAGIEWTRRFDINKAIDGYLDVYEQALRLDLRPSQPQQTMD